MLSRMSNRFFVRLREAPKRATRRSFPYVELTGTIYAAGYCILLVCIVWCNCRQSDSGDIFWRQHLLICSGLTVFFHAIFALPTLATLLYARRLQNRPGKAAFAAWAASFGVIPGFFITYDLNSLGIFILAYCAPLTILTAVTRSTRHTVSAAVIYALYFTEIECLVLLSKL